MPHTVHLTSNEFVDTRPFIFPDHIIQDQAVLRDMTGQVYVLLEHPYLSS
ncbi:MAG: hypothetical protein GY796_34570 [Chloroflexi bacterium]|nr:hypothetical protein [Chloroflexota bacterium]